MPHIVNTGSVGPAGTEAKIKDEPKPVPAKDLPKAKSKAKPKD